LARRFKTGVANNQLRVIEGAAAKGQGGVRRFGEKTALQ
jgi:hypothetical protein